ncbi:hypothetical protein Tsubulata_038833 [Turnera subulata]|uniref:Tyrosine decarboxylase n=1 Tax=Turnera subulata TaxID=218843 RepID=A0A9Q0G9L2_9ROSI|nr:hypothetical protein Tsubulata_038833 [Turnera subulata]
MAGAPSALATGSGNDEEEGDTKPNEDLFGWLFVVVIMILLALLCQKHKRGSSLGIVDVGSRNFGSKFLQPLFTRLERWSEFENDEDERSLDTTDINANIDCLIKASWYSTFHGSGAGIPPSNVRCLPTAFSEGFSLSSQALEDAIERDIDSGFIPLYLCATIGTTGCGAVDPVEKLGKVARKYNQWFHIDAACAGSACICPEFRHYLDATESHKVIDYKDWQIALSRRFRALKLWVMIHRHGLAGLRFHIRSDVKLASFFESLVAKDSRFEVVVPRKFALVCFRLKAGQINNEDNALINQELNKKLLQEVNESGKAFMTHAVVGGVYFIRCYIGSTLTEERHVEDLWKLIQEKATEVLTNAEEFSLSYSSIYIGLTRRSRIVFVGSYSGQNSDSKV